MGIPSVPTGQLQRQPCNERELLAKGKVTLMKKNGPRKGEGRQREIPALRCLFPLKFYMVWYVVFYTLLAPTGALVVLVY